jgi:hypothetical protein
MSAKTGTGALFFDDFRLYSVAAKKPEPQSARFASIRRSRQQVAPMTWPEATKS